MARQVMPAVERLLQIETLIAAQTGRIVVVELGLKIHFEMKLQVFPLEGD